MKNRIITSLLVGGSVLLSGQVQAQTATLGTVFDSSAGSGKKRLSGPSASQLQTQDSSGWVSTQSVSVEAGHNDNVDKFFTNGNASSYGRVDGSLLLGYVSEGGATTFAAKGQLFQYDEDVKNNSRWDAGAAIDNDYALNQWMRVGFGGYYLRDEVDVIPTDKAGGYASLGYVGSFMDANMVGRVDDIEYSGAYPFPANVPASLTAYVRPGEFSYRRSEVAVDFILAKQRAVAFYAEIGGGDVDYTDQKIPGLIDRDANELWTFSGVRWKPDPTVVIDIGYRYNRRDFEDGRLNSFDSSFVDGKIVWAPGDNFALQFEVDRVIAKPISIFALATDQKTYALSAVFKPTGNSSITPYARFRDLDQIGDTTSYEERVIGVSGEINLSNKVTLYSHMQQENLKETTTSVDMDQLKGGVGVKVRF